MKGIQKILGILMLAIAGLGISACQKSPINGDLDGMWQVMEVTPQPEVVLPHHRIYYNFYMHVVQLSVFDYGVWTTGNMSYDGETVKMDFPYRHDDMEVKLRQFGIDSNPVVFQVEKLDGKSLILKNGDTVVTMRKF